jgi:acetate kinase
MKILVLNSGSSSQKSSLYEVGDSVPDDPPPCQWEGKIEWDGEVAEVSLKNAKGAARKERTRVGSRAEAIEQLLGTLWDGDTRAVSAASDIVKIP